VNKPGRLVTKMPSTKIQGTFSDCKPGKLRRRPCSTHPYSREVLIPLQTSNIRTTIWRAAERWGKGGENFMEFRFSLMSHTWSAAVPAPAPKHPATRNATSETSKETNQNDGQYPETQRVSAAPAPCSRPQVRISVEYLTRRSPPVIFLTVLGV
jgi:hypothetical protein